MLVVLFHAFPGRLAGGFIGVDIFFVISGYLISSIILKEISTHRFTIIGFYKKRINRIFPALIFVLLFSLIAARILMLKTEMADFNLSVFFSTTFLANIFFLNTLNYFDNTAEDHPLLHFWSLGVEEQFYIFWPLLLVFIARKPQLVALSIISFLLASSFFLNILFVEKYQSHVFYSPVTRLWELGFGSLCAYYKTTNIEVWLKAKLPFSYVDDIFTTLGLSLIIYCELIIKPSSAFPGWYALLPVVGSGLIILFGGNSKLSGSLLANPILVFIGLISYPLYLWHWPLLSFSHINQGYLITTNFKLGLVIASFFFAVVTYYFVEVPIRFKIKHQLKPLFLLIGLFAIGAYSLLSYRHQLLAVSSDSDNFVTFYKKYVQNNDFVKNNRVDCGFINNDGSLRDSLPEDCDKSDVRPSILLWGDSHAYQFYSGLNMIAGKPYQLLQVASSGCEPFDPERQHLHKKKNCLTANKRSLNIIRSTKPNLVLLAQKDKHDETDWKELAIELKAMGVQKVILLGPVPQWNEYLYRYLAKNYKDLANIPAYLNGDILNKEIIDLDRKLQDKYAKYSEIQYISIVDLLCTPEKGCLTYFYLDNHKELTTFDYGHLTLSASTQVSESIMKAIQLK